MSSTAETRGDAPEQLVERVQDLQEALETAPASATRDLAEELVSAVVQLYGEGLERIVARLGADGLTDDPLLATLLLIHDLHPVSLEQRVQAALDSVRPYMESHGGNVELLSLRDGVATIHLQGSCSDCSASSVTLELAIKQALEDHAPDLVELVVEGVEKAMTGVPLPMAGAAPAATWLEIDGVETLANGALGSVDAAGRPLVVANLDGTLLAYEDRCAGCGGTLRGGTVAGGALACPLCGQRFLLARAGRSVAGDGLQLAPVPLLREGGSVKVAIAA